MTKIRNIHLDYEEIEKAYKVERIALEKKFLEQKKLVIEKRRQIVTGEVEVPAEEGEGKLITSILSLSLYFPYISI